MDERIYNLHIEAGRIAGQDKTCGKKAAQRAANAHNRWDKRRHDVEPYPCAFCNKWHIGNIMPVEVLERIINESNEEED